MNPNLPPSQFRPEVREQDVQAGAAMILRLGADAIQLAMIERAPRYTPERPENDAEHSFMVTLIGTEFAAEYYPWLDPGLVSRFFVVHELVEKITKDVATYKLSDAELAQKNATEHSALPQLWAQLPQHTRALHMRYEQQEEPEARYVRAFEKCAGVLVDILGAGREVMAEDFGVTTAEEVRVNNKRLSERYRAMFPEPELDLVHAVREALGERFAEKMELSAD